MNIIEGTIKRLLGNRNKNKIGFRTGILLGIGTKIGTLCKLQVRNINERTRN